MEERILRPGIAPDGVRHLLPIAHSSYALTRDAAMVPSCSHPIRVHAGASEAAQSSPDVPMDQVVSAG
jgi:hypothetical protein